MAAGRVRGRARSAHITRPAGSLAVVVLIVCSAVVLLIVGMTGWEEYRIGRMAAALSTLTGIAGLFVSAWQLRMMLREARSRPASSESVMRETAEALAHDVRTQWEREAGFRALRRPEPLRVHWSTTRRAVSARPEFIVGRSAVGRPIALRLNGTLDDSATILNWLPKRQLVVLGEPGAGKTVLALLLVLELAARRRPDDPVPVLFSLLSWDPRSEDLYSWLTRRIREDYPGVGLRGPDTIAHLVADAWILPVLDGLDEMPSALRMKAIEEILRAVEDKPLVLTCRSEEYEQVVRAGGLLPAAAVIELEPVTTSDAMDFLSIGTAADAERWGPVAEHLRAKPDGPVAKALSTPFMVSLAREVYRVPPADPAELIDTERFPDRKVIEAHLLDVFLPAVYETNDGGRGTRWSAAHANRWLRFLATRMHEHSTLDFAWWRLHRSISRRRALLAHLILATLGSGVLAASTTWLAAGPGAAMLATSLVVPTMAALVLGIAFFGTVPQRPTRFRVEPHPAATAVDRVRAAAVAGIAPGVIAGVLLSVVLDDIAVGVAGGLLVAIVGAVQGALLSWSRFTEHALAASPWTVLRQDRSATVGIGLVIGAAFGITTFVVFSGTLGFSRQLVVLALGAFLGGFVPSLGTAWSWYQGARISLALRRNLPWRLTAFLKDAHHRGVLRQSGAVLQFRHSRLQEHLASSER